MQVSMQKQLPELPMRENADSASYSVVVSPGGAITASRKTRKAGDAFAFWLFGEADKGRRFQEAPYLVMTAHWAKENCYEYCNHHA